METELMKMILQAKRLWMIDHTQEPSFLIQKFGLTFEEFCYWLKHIYPEKEQMFLPVARNLFSRREDGDPC